MKHKIIQNCEFPTLPNKITDLYLDTETTSFDPKKKSVYVWRDCWVAGIAFTWDDHDTCYFIPVRYRDAFSEFKNQPIEDTYSYLRKVISVSTNWINHNIKYDYHVLSREGVDVSKLRLKDTLTKAKLVRSDRFRYDEDSLAFDWLGIQDADKYKQEMLPDVANSKDWGEIPIRKMGPYAAHDVYKNRLLCAYINSNLHSDCLEVAELEEKVTQCLCRCEQVGLTVDPKELRKEEYDTTQNQLVIAEKIRSTHGIIMRPNVNKDCLEVFHHQLGFPIVGYTEKGEPSYDKYALKTLLQYPGIPTELVEDCLKYREDVSHNGFIKSYRKHELDNRLHCSYNQCVQTGRMSCKAPNMMQLNKRAKKFIHPHEDHVFLSFDYSSIEFRLIAHYLGQPDILAAYEKDPDTDFHEWVAGMCSVKRDPAKTINFCMAFGGGKGKVLSMLANNADIIEELEAASPEAFEELCRLRAEEIFNKYRRVLHKLRPTTQMAANRMKTRGFVRNGYGRHRHLPAKAAYRGFNSVIQSTAADCMKEAVVATSPIFNKVLADYGVEQVAYVHDEILFICPKEHIEDWYFEDSSKTLNEKGEWIYIVDGPLNPVITEISRAMTAGADRFTVPIRVSAAIGKDNWADCIELPKELTYNVQQ